MRVSSAPDTAGTVVVLRGEIDYDCEAALERSLAHALSCSARGIDIDLSKVSFWACSSVKVLLVVRQLALRQDKTMSLRATSPRVRRVLELTDTLQLFTTRTSPASPPPPSPAPAKPPWSTAALAGASKAPKAAPATSTDEVAAFTALGTGQFTASTP
ncbi:STAS domain-containing protein [Streptomyces sp. Edi2]|uniref:STAS domain-containing protein n=1 Tax=Streptomyces sp. Edi2 TaxID=3162528 RepID=UPI0033068A92